MTQDRWQRVEQLFDAARRLPAVEREPFLESACRGDADLQREVASLLAQSDSNESFLGTPAIEALATHALHAGTQVSHYRIVRHIGAGGMGTVYLAEDTSLKRQVALKFLPPERVGGSVAAARLLREARAASALDHPHIATVYEIGDDAGQPFIAMAYYDGETLADRLARESLGMAEVARILAQIADALAAAHAAGREGRKG